MHEAAWCVWKTAGSSELLTGEDMKLESDHGGPYVASKELEILSLTWTLVVI